MGTVLWFQIYAGHMTILETASLVMWVMRSAMDHAFTRNQITPNLVMEGVKIGTITTLYASNALPIGFLMPIIVAFQSTTSVGRMTRMVLALVAIKGMTC